MKNQSNLILCLTLLAACSDDHALPPGGGQSAVLAPACTTQPTDCMADADCCKGAHCQLHNVYALDWRMCVAQLADGASCTRDAECAAGRCNNYRCGDAKCAAAAVECSTDTDCCAGLYCYNWTYAAHVCKAAAPTGTSCESDAHCASGHCVDYVCAQ